MSYNDELYHWGIKGMKWGIRRFQKKDGTLTALGKKRKRDDGDDEPRKPKSVKDMSDAELRAETNRLNLEQQYLTAKSNVERLNPRQLSMGEKFANTFKNKVVPELTNVGTRLLGQYVEKRGKQLLGLSDDDSLAGLKKEVEKLKLTKEKTEIQKYLENGGKKDKGNNQSKKDKNNNNQSNKQKNNDQKNDAQSNKDSGSKPKTDTSSKPKTDTKPESTPAPKSPAKPGFSPSNSNSQSVHRVFMDHYSGYKYSNSAATSVNKLLNSGYSMSSLEKMNGGKLVGTGKTATTNIVNSGWSMRGLDDLEKYGFRR